MSISESHNLPYDNTRMPMSLSTVYIGSADEVTIGTTIGTTVQSICRSYFVLVSRSPDRHYNQYDASRSN
eukprot:3559630-Pyramimonas_sp.AAC.1